MKWWMRQMQPLRKGSAFASAFNKCPFLKWATFRGILVVPLTQQRSTWAQSWINAGSFGDVPTERLEVSGRFLIWGGGVEVILAVWSRQKVVKRDCSCQWSWLMPERLWNALGCRLKSSAAPRCSAAPSAQSYLRETPAHRPDSGPGAEV